LKQSIAHIALVVRDYDEAIAFYVNKLRFELVEDTYQPEQDKRWVVVRPPGDGATSLLLARASTPHQETFIGNQAGGRVFLCGLTIFSGIMPPWSRLASSSFASRNRRLMAPWPYSRICTAICGISCNSQTVVSERTTVRISQNGTFGTWRRVDGSPCMGKRDNQ
jgi:hypothetical protein